LSLLVPNEIDVDWKMLPLSWNTYYKCIIACNCNCDKLSKDIKSVKEAAKRDSELKKVIFLGWKSLINKIHLKFFLFFRVLHEGLSKYIE